MNNPTDQYNGDVVFYFGPIVREGYDKVSSIFEGKPKKSDKVCIVLVTYGGDPDAAYRIARAARHHYSNVEVLIPDVCKSAGTLLCIGASKLIFGDRGELGPLDIQLSKPDELFGSMSGLDIIQALNALQAQLLDSFRTYLVDIRGGSRISTKTASDIAVHLANGLITPIAEKINPLTLGEHLRAMSIASEYGERLNDMAKSLKPNALNTLVSGYSSHGFVIDRKEASLLFNNVSAPDETTIDIYSWARQVIDKLPTGKLVVCDVDVMFNEIQSKATGVEKGENATSNDNGDTKESDGVAKKPEPKGKRNVDPNSKARTPKHDTSGKQ